MVTAGCSYILLGITQLDKYSDGRERLETRLVFDIQRHSDVLLLGDQQSNTSEAAENPQASWWSKGSPGIREWIGRFITETEN